MQDNDKNNEHWANIEEGVSPSDDFRFPSGRWSGVWWHGPRFFPCSMWFEATCSDGKIVGEGADPIGTFTLSLEVTALMAAARLSKHIPLADRFQYFGGHLADGDRVGIAGNWFLDEGWGRFWLEPRRPKQGQRDVGAAAK